MTPKEQLEAARELLSNKARWTQGWFAHDADGDECGAEDADAVRWCARGALYKIGAGDVPEVDALLGNAAFDMQAPSPEYVNDNLGYEATMQMYERAIELASR